MEILLPVSYFPPVSYCAAFLNRKKIILEAEETYPKQTIRNHCFILGPNGKQKLTVPVIRQYGNHTKTKDIRTDNSSSWQRQHLKSIETAYNKSPFFLYYQDDIASLLMRKHDFLIDLDTDILRMILKILKTDKEISVTDEFRKDAGRFDYSSGKDFVVYTQVFSDRFPFVPDLSILDLLFNMGNDSSRYLATL